jgi:uncharacterized integral membrane protein (TIGR00697 family)
MNYSKTFLWVAVLFVASLIISNTVATKLVELGPFIVSGGVIIFPLTYIFGDILTEVYGFTRARQVIWLGFLAQLLMVLCYVIVQWLPYPEFWMHQDAYAAILGFVPRIVLASLIGYLAGEYANSVILSRMKVWSKGKALWKRTISSTVVGQLVDTVLFALIAFGGMMPLSALLFIGLSGYVLKVAYEVIATPLTYKIVRYLKRVDQVDVYDTNVSYAPFGLYDRK